MNTARHQDLHNPAPSPGELAPITRIGGGEVRVDKAHRGADRRPGTRMTSPAASPSATRPLTGLEGIRARRSSSATTANKARTVHESPPRSAYADDAASGAVAVTAPATVRVPANGAASFNVKRQGRRPELPDLEPRRRAQRRRRRPPPGHGVRRIPQLTSRHATDTVHLAWHDPAAPRGGRGTGVHERRARRRHRLGRDSATRAARSTATSSVFSLLGTSAADPTAASRPRPATTTRSSTSRRSAPGCAVRPYIQFADQHVRHPRPPELPGRVRRLHRRRPGRRRRTSSIYNPENGGFGATGQNVVRVVNLAHRTRAPTYFYTDADLNSAQRHPHRAAGGPRPHRRRPQFDFSVYAFDNYFTGNLHRRHRGHGLHALEAAVRRDGSDQAPSRPTPRSS